MAAAVYVLCALTSLACAVLLLRAYARNHVRLLLWSGLCFCGLFINNALLFTDRIVLPEIDLLLVREFAALVGLLLLLYGLIWETE
jgi:hypothetical protein